MRGFEVGGFVKYLENNELGLIGATTDFGAYCWFHEGGTRALTEYCHIAPISPGEAAICRFNNECAKASLFERQERMSEGSDYSDLIDRDDIRSSIYEVFAKRGEL